MHDLLDRLSLVRTARPAVGEKIGIFWPRATVGVLLRAGWMGVTIREPDGDTLVIRWHTIQGWEMGKEIDAVFNERVETIEKGDAVDPALTAEEQEELLMRAQL